MNTLFRKGYLLAGVLMAANMFAVNEIKASSPGLSFDLNRLENQQNPQEQNPLFTGKKEGEDNKKQSSLDKLLSWENYFNFFGTLALSGANNYFKWWDYNAGSYCNLRIGCLGWRTKKFFDIVQLDFNLNLWRGIGWSIPHFIKFRRSLTKTEKIDENTKNNEEGKTETNSNADSWVSFLFKDILRGFVSIPLTLHFSKFNFSISISLDSILWEFVIGRFFNTDEKGGKKNETELNSQILIKEKNEINNSSFK